jgi:hypothetical protein
LTSVSRNAALPIARRRKRDRRPSWQAGGVDVHPRVTGVRNALALPMVGGRLKGSPCLQRADERHTLVNALGRTSYTPNPRSLRDFGTPLSRRPNPHALGGVLVACAQALRTERAYSLSSSFG